MLTEVLTNYISFLVSFNKNKLKPVSAIATNGKLSGQLPITFTWSMCPKIISGQHQVGLLQKHTVQRICTADQ